jgi:CheY-like chemotaxis protein
MARILIVDDDETLTLVLTHYFRKAGHTPLPAPTGHGALLAARAHPDVILLDLRLPDMSGAEVLRRLKRDPTTASIPVVVVSGEPDAAESVPRNGSTGAVAVLQKPVGGAALCAVVDLVLASRERDEEKIHGASLPANVPVGPQHREILYRLLRMGSDPLVRQLVHRLAADRSRRDALPSAEAPNWRDLARAGRQEGLLNDGEGALLASGPAEVAAVH